MVDGAQLTRPIASVTPALHHASAPRFPPLLRLKRVRKAFGPHLAVDGVSLDLGEGEFFCLLGPSGCGKSTLLRLIAGFEIPDSGSIRLGEQDLIRLPPHRRPVNMMFQSYALFPHMSVARNIAYGLKGLGLGRAETAERMARLLKLVRLQGFEARRPDRLSGGQRQRVALVRALAREPQVLLLDEPLGALDRALREETREELRTLQRRLGTSFVVVTHDPEEAMALADCIGVMDRGRLAQVGPAAELYQRPVSRFVAELLGDVNLIEGRLAGAPRDGFARVETRHGSIRAALASGLEASEAGKAVCVAIRPERLRVLADDGAGWRREEGEANALLGAILDATFLGDRVRRQVRMADGAVLRASAGLAEAANPGIGEAVRLVFPPDSALALPV